MIEQLEISEAEIDDVETIRAILGSAFKADHLRRLSLSKNCLSTECIKCVEDVLTKRNHFQSLILSRCEIGKDGLEIL